MGVIPGHVALQQLERGFEFQHEKFENSGFWRLSG
jgi:hypothetical protein